MAAATLNRILERGQGDDLAIDVPGGTRLTYRELREQVAAVADELSRMGLGRGDRIALVLPNCVEAIVLFVAAATVGTAAPLNPAYKEDEFRFYLEDVDARALVVPPGQAAAARRAIPSGAILVEASLDEAGSIRLESETPRDESRSAGGPADEDIALVLHTSGTTSRPKLVPLRQRNLFASARSIADTYRLAPDDVALCVMPLFHIHGLMASTMATLASGGAVVLPAKFDPMTFWPVVHEHSATWYSAVPTIHQMLLMRNRGERPPGSAKLRFIRSSSSALSPETMRQLELRFGAPVLEAYGMTEASHQMASNPLPPGDRRPGTVGVGTGVQIGIMDEGQAMLPSGVHGEVVIQGPSVTDGYANNAEANAKSFTAGWFRTGDQGTLGPEGYLTLIGRLKEMINRGGEKIAPREIDDALLQHPAVGEAVAFGCPHPTWGEEVAAAVVLKGEASEKEIIAFARERLADYKVPKKLYIVDQIPRTATGKIQRRTVADALNARQ
ncbi:MAG: AMP-dependent synthetase [Chloroflexi bacterium 13_1_40CM_4_65_16]|nr:MAG: AMP-dependent synthetase [Chloroflexi bacterium 13_1_40CM_4_65_16]TMF69935.1 MAG: AMP-dependent synthetase [Chloroflexota bacterium]TMF84179.1 MAG: AMP-dependent synthetase [Chloroflexota bacterium]TMG13581.1 MAG: AMP-dependent synthetase [Chloroflexota bacterium]